MNLTELVPWVTACVAVLGLVLSVARGRRNDVENTQQIKDRLTYISDTTRDTREDVRDMSRKLDDHAARLTRVEEQVKDHERRLEKLET